MKNSSLLITISSAMLLGLLAITIRPSEASPEAAQEEPTSNVVEPSAVTDVSPLVFNYQGQLTNVSGNPITNASLPMTFRLYTVLTGGTACWTESQTVNVANGQFNVLLGQTTAIPTSCTSGNAYLELVVNGETLSPRELLTSVATAAKANTIVNGANTQGDLTVTGALSVVNNLYVESAIASPGSTNLTIDAGWGSTNDVQMIGGLNLTNNGGADDIRMGGSTMGHTIVRRDGGRTLHFVPWGGPSYRYDDICVGCASENVGFRVNGPLTTYGSMTATNVIYANGGLNVGAGIVSPPNVALELDAGQGTISQISLSENVVVYGNLVVKGNCNVETSNRWDETWMSDTSCEAGSITSGAYVEANLMTNEERISEAIDRFEKGDLLCWSAEGNRLEKCSSANDPLVMGVADANGKPIVLGAEQIKVLGPVKVGDYLVASDVPGYATASDDPSFGIVIGQALEDLEGEQGLIKAMIRKM